MKTGKKRQVPLIISESQPASVSKWLRSLKDGDEGALQQLWDRYFKKLIAHATKRIRRYNCPEGILVPEDIAASVFESIWEGANAGRFQNVTDRDELWWLLQAMTCRKVIDHIRRETALRRFPGQPPVSLSQGDPDDMYREPVSDEPTPEDIVIVEELYSFLLRRLRDDQLRQIAVLKVEGYSNDEIREELGISSAGLVRKLKLIRETWQQALADQDADNGADQDADNGADQGADNGADQGADNGSR